MELETLKNHIRNIPDFPKPGITFRDISTLLLEPEAFRQALDEMQEWLDSPGEVAKIAAIESRGFLFGAALADRMNLGLVLIRKSGKLPGDVHEEAYDLEYGTDTLELHKDAIKPGEKVFLVDDLLATGGTGAAAIRLVEKSGGTVTGAGFLIELDALEGRQSIPDHHVVSLIHY